MASVGFAFSRFLRCFIDYKGLLGFASLIFHGGGGGAHFLAAGCLSCSDLLVPLDLFGPRPIFPIRRPDFEASQLSAL